jgi:hypothetical protein
MPGLNHHIRSSLVAPAIGIHYRITKLHRIVRRFEKLSVVGAEVPPQCLPVRLSAQCGGDLIPGPVGGASLAHGQLESLLSDAPGIGGGLDQLLNRCRHAMNIGTFYVIFQGSIRVSPSAFVGSQDATGETGRKLRLSN